MFDEGRPVLLLLFNRIQSTVWKFVSVDITCEHCNILYFHWPFLQLSLLAGAHPHNCALKMPSTPQNSIGGRLRRTYILTASPLWWTTRKYKSGEDALNKITGRREKRCRRCLAWRKAWRGSIYNSLSVKETMVHRPYTLSSSTVNSNAEVGITVTLIITAISYGYPTPSPPMEKFPPNTVPPLMPLNSHLNEIPLTSYQLTKTCVTSISWPFLYPSALIHYAHRLYFPYAASTFPNERSLTTTIGS